MFISATTALAIWAVLISHVTEEAMDAFDVRVGVRSATKSGGKFSEVHGFDAQQGNQEGG